MTLLRRPAARFVLWVVLLVGVAAAAGFAGWSWGVIVGLEFATWVIVAVCERKLSGPWTTRAIAAHFSPLDTGELLDELLQSREQDAFEAGLEPLPVVRTARDVPQEESLPEAPAHRRRVMSRKPRPAPVALGTEWNVWTLEEVVRENAPHNDELVYLTVSLRDFADANGLLPAGFDPLVRESFGSLLPAAS